MDKSKNLIDESTKLLAELFVQSLFKKYNLKQKELSLNLSPQQKEIIKSLVTSHENQLKEVLDNDKSPK